MSAMAVGTLTQSAGRHDGCESVAGHLAFPHDAYAVTGNRDERRGQAAWRAPSNDHEAVDSRDMGERLDDLFVAGARGFTGEVGARCGERCAKITRQASSGGVARPANGHGCVEREPHIDVRLGGKRDREGAWPES